MSESHEPLTPDDLPGYSRKAIASIVAVARADAAKEARAQIAESLRQHAASAWGDHASWLTTGAKVAELAAGWVEDTDLDDAPYPTDTEATR